MKQCPVCDAEFEPTNNRQKFCTKRCFNRSRFLLLREAIGIRACETCGETITGTGLRFCSRSCIRRRSERDCEFCSEPFLPRGRQRFCSQRCKSDASCVPVGTRRVVGDGYVVVRVPDGTPGTRGDRAWMLEHRYVMQQHLGRPLDRNETVHHKNLDHADNAIENLQLRVGRHGKGAVLVCLDCGSSNVGATEL